MLISPERRGVRSEGGWKRKEKRKRTVVSGPSHGLSTVPAGESVGGEARVYKGKVGRKEDMVQVVIIIVDLGAGELTLVDNVLAG